MSDWVARREALQPQCREEIARCLTLGTMALRPYRYAIVKALARQLADARSKTGGYWGDVGGDVMKGYEACFAACQRPQRLALPPMSLETLIAHVSYAGRTFQLVEDDVDGFGFGTIAEFERDLAALRTPLGRFVCRAARQFRRPPPEPREIEADGWYVLTFKRGFRTVKALAPLQEGGRLEYSRLNATAFAAARAQVGESVFAVTPRGHHTYLVGTSDGNLRLPLTITVGRSKAASGKTGRGPFLLVSARRAAEL